MTEQEAHFGQDPRPFRIAVPDDVLVDLQQRLARARWPGEVKGVEFGDGMSQGFMQKLVEYWQGGYDWRKAEAKLNALAQFHLEINGSNLHFIHERGKSQQPIPILLLHGWADSFHGMTPLIPLLTEDQEGLSFDVVAPSMPGFGFSDKVWSQEFSAEQNADQLHDLMNALGYPHYMVFGGDWGGVVGEQIALRHPDAVTGLHLSDVPFPRIFSVDREDVSDAEKTFLDAMDAWGQTESGYVLVQSTKPQNLAYGLTDSPVALAAWLAQHFHAYSDGKLDQDELLNNIMIYWITNSIRSSMRLYKSAADRWGTESTENGEAPYTVQAGWESDWGEIQRVEVPTAVMIFPKDIGQPPQEYAERFFDVRRFTMMPRGGHFAALEEPELVAAELREFAATLTQPSGVFSNQAAGGGIAD